MINLFHSILLCVSPSHQAKGEYYASTVKPFQVALVKPVVYLKTIINFSKKFQASLSLQRRGSTEGLGSFGLEVSRKSKAFLIIYKKTRAVKEIEYSNPYGITKRDMLREAKRVLGK